MCGIFGCVDIDISRDVVDRCCDSLTHRGPDGRGVWIGEHVALAHRRLSIIDLTDNASQPMSYLGGRYYITFNGEIYNYIELKKELKEAGYAFQSDSDTEVILAAYCKWGSECVLRFNGMWAFAIYDTKNKELFISRDRYGVKPLYYSLHNGGFIFGSEMKSITPCFNKVETNKRMINFFRYLHHYEFMEDCLIKNIKRFPAGSNGTYKDGKLTLKKYWNTLDNLITVPTKYEDQVFYFRELFEDACKLRMRSDVTIGTALSGGLDSSAVLCTMNVIANRKDAYQKDWQHAYVAGFNGSILDETAYAKMVTDHIGISSTYIDIDNRIDQAELYRQTYVFEELWMNSQIPQMAVYGQERSHGTVVSIDGHGADELFGGYEFDIQNALLNQLTDEERLDIADTIFVSEQGREYDDLSELIGWEKNRRFKSSIRNYYEHIYRNLVLKSKYIHHKNYKKMDHLNKALCIETHEKVLPTMLRNYDRTSMASGVEIRMPFMDYRIVEFAFSVDYKAKLNNKHSKAIIRDALSCYMPKEIAYRKDKKGFNAPLNEWMRNSSEIYLDQVNSQDFINCDLVKNPKNIKKELEFFMKNKETDYEADLIKAQKLWMEINMYVWEQVMIKQRIN